MNLRVLTPDNRILRQICEKVTLKELKLKSTQKLIDLLLDFVYGKNNKGYKRNRNKPMTVGLSANQVGILKRISIVDLAIGRKNISDIHVLINPEIIWYSKTLIEKSEGCVNLPNIWGYVKRNKRIKVKAYDRSGNELLLTLSGWPAILLQHEIDHLNGILFIDRLADPTQAHLVKANQLSKYRKMNKSWLQLIDVTNLTRKNRK